MLTEPRWLGAALLVWLLTPADGWGQVEQPAGTSPRWSYELRGGWLRPDLEQFETFYGDDQETYFALAASFRVLDWLELGGEYGHMRATGVGLLTSSAQLGGTVEFRLSPIHVYANAIWQRTPQQRLVPYAGVGIATIVYAQDVDQQPDVDGRTDVGFAVRAGLRVLLMSREPVRGASSRRSRGNWRSYAFVEAQHTSAEVDGIELGGDALVLGFRMEFSLPLRP